MRIVHVITGIATDSGGPTVVVKELANRLVARRHEVFVLTTDTSVSGRRLELETATVGYDARVRLGVYRGDLVLPPYPSRRHFAAVCRAIRNVDVAHVHGVFALPVTAAMAAFRARGLPYVLRPCGMLDPYSLTERWFLKRVWLALIERANVLGAAAIQTSTEHEASALRAFLPEKNHERVRIIPQGVEQLGSPTGRRLHPRPYLLFLSRLAKKKNLLGLIAAFGRLARRWPELDLVLVGPDERGHRAVVEHAIATHGLRERVVVAGPAYGADKVDWYAGAEVFVLPSHDENFGIVVIEAAQLGVPLVVSEGVGLSAAVRVHEAGMVTESVPESLASALETALMRGREGFAPGLEALATTFAWDRVIDRLELLYREVVGNNRSHNA